MGEQNLDQWAKTHASKHTVMTTLHVAAASFVIQDDIKAKGSLCGA